MDEAQTPMDALDSNEISVDLSQFPLDKWIRIWPTRIEILVCSHDLLGVVHVRVCEENNE